MVLDYRMLGAFPASTLSCAYRAGWRVPTRPARAKLRGMSQWSGRALRGCTIPPVLGLPGRGDARGQPRVPPTVETRAVPGQDVKQVNAQGIIDAPPHVVRAVVADRERYPEVMASVEDSR